MLIAATIAFLLMHYGSSSMAMMWPYDQIEKLITQDVADEVRQKQAMEIVAHMKAANKASDKEREKSVDVLLKLTSKRDTPIEEIERAGQPLIAEDKLTAEKLLDMRFQLKAVMTASEWTKVFAARAAASRRKVP